MSARSNPSNTSSHWAPVSIDIGHDSQLTGTGRSESRVNGHSRTHTHTHLSISVFLCYANRSRSCKKEYRSSWKLNIPFHQTSSICLPTESWVLIQGEVCKFTSSIVWRMIILQLYEGWKGKTITGLTNSTSMKPLEDVTHVFWMNLATEGLSREAKKIRKKEWMEWAAQRLCVSECKYDDHQETWAGLLKRRSFGTCVGLVMDGPGWIKFQNTRFWEWKSGWTERTLTQHVSLCALPLFLKVEDVVRDPEENTSLF